MSVGQNADRNVKKIYIYIKAQEKNTRLFMCLSQCVCSLTKSFSVKLFMTLGDTAKKETVYWDPRRESVLLCQTRRIATFAMTMSANGGHTQRRG